MAVIDRRGVSVSAIDTPIAGNPNPGLAIKAPVAAATTGNITLSGLQTIDGVVLAAGNRVLVWQQADPTTNGIYNASTGPWTRAIDALSNDQLTQGTLVLAAQGATQGKTLFELTAANPIQLGTTAMTFAIAGSGLALTRTNDTNVTLTLGGSPAVALLAATSLTLGWSGTLAVARGGTGAGAASGAALDNITGFSSTGFLQRTGAGAYSFMASGAANGLATLDAGGKLTSAQIPSSLVGALQYQGTWNANTNSPALASGVGTKGQYYKVAVAGSTAIDGISQWNAGDSIVFDGTVWDKIDGLSSEVITVAGRFGNVLLAAGDISGLAPSATTDTTNAANIISGLLAVARGGTGDAGTAWSPTTPTPVPIGGAFTTASAVVRVKVEGKKILIWAQVTITAVGTATSGFSVAIPNAALNTSPVAGIDNNVGTGFLAYVSGSTLTFSVTPANHVYYANGSYEAA